MTIFGFDNSEVSLLPTGGIIVIRPQRDGRQIVTGSPVSSTMRLQRIGKVADAMSDADTTAPLERRRSVSVSKDSETMAPAPLTVQLCSWTWMGMR